jgi:hypothetical protein
MSDSTNHHYLSEWGFENWIVLDTSIKIKNDQEEDTQGLRIERNEEWNIISNLIKNRTVTEAPRVRDCYKGWTGEDREYWNR